MVTSTLPKSLSGGLQKSLAGLGQKLEASNKGASTVKIDPRRIKILPQIRGKNNRGFTNESLTELGNTIKAVGQLQAITVRPLSGDPDFDYVLVAGERRVRSAILVGIDALDANVRHISDEEAKTIQRIENALHEALSEAELLEAVKSDLAELGKANLVAKRWGKTESWVSKVLALDDLGEVAQSLVSEGLSGDREVLTTVSRLEKANPELAKRLVNQIKNAPADANVRTIVSKGVKAAREQQKDSDRAADLTATLPGVPAKPKAKPTPEKALSHAWSEIVDHGVPAAHALDEYKKIEPEVVALLKQHFQDGKKAAQSNGVAADIVERLTRGDYAAEGAAGMAMIAFLEGAHGARFSVTAILNAAAAARR